MHSSSPILLMLFAYSARCLRCLTGICEERDTFVSHHIINSLYTKSIIQTIPLHRNIPVQHSPSLPFTIFILLLSLPYLSWKLLPPEKDAIFTCRISTNIRSIVLMILLWIICNILSNYAQVKISGLFLRSAEHQQLVFNPKSASFEVSEILVMDSKNLAN